MGLIRKTMSVGTLGLVDFRSDKERTARYARHTRNAVRAQSRMQANLAQQQMMHAPIPATAPGWYNDPHGQARLRWWDGGQWTPHIAP